MSRYQPGEIIALWWEDDPAEIHAYGHVSDDEFRAAVDANYGEWGRLPTIVAPPVHAWAAFRLNGSDEFGSPKQTLRVYSERGRGMFPITYTDALTWRRVEPCSEHRCRRAEGHEGDHACYPETP